jgi:hypothetical protein
MSQVVWGGCKSTRAGLYRPDMVLVEASVPGVLPAELAMVVVEEHRKSTLAAEGKNIDLFVDQV